MTQSASPVQRGVGAVRSGLRDAVTPLPTAEQALVPALVDGDDAAMPDDVVLDFQTTGLTHLLAVSGSNLTLVLAFVLVVGSMAAACAAAAPRCSVWWRSCSSSCWPVRSRACFGLPRWAWSRSRGCPRAVAVAGPARSASP